MTCKVWFFVLLFFIIKVGADKISSWPDSSIIRQDKSNEYVLLTLFQDAMCEQAIDLEWECLFQWQVCTFMPQMERYFWFEKTSYGQFFKICEDWMCLNCSLCGGFEESSGTCISMPYFNIYGRIEQVEWSSDPPVTTSTSIPSTTAQTDPSATASITPDPPSSPTPTPKATSSPTNIPLSSHSGGGNQKIGDHNATHTSSSGLTPTPQPTHATPLSTLSPQQSQPVSSKIHQSSGGLSGGSIAGIVIGSIAGSLVAVVVTTLFVRRRRALRNMRTLHDNSTTSMERQ